MKILQADLHEDTRLFTQAADVEDSPKNLLAKYAETRAAISEKKTKALNDEDTEDEEAVEEDLTETVFANYLILSE